MFKLSFTINFHLKTFLVIVLCFFYSPVIEAQKKDKAHKNHAANKRVFYGEASFYADKFNGRHTANGDIFNQNNLTCACNMLPFGTFIKVSNVANGKSAIVKVTDRLHPKMRRIVDLTKATALKLGFHGRGVARVKIELLAKKSA